MGYGRIVQKQTTASAEKERRSRNGAGSRAFVGLQDEPSLCLRRGFVSPTDMSPQATCPETSHYACGEALFLRPRLPAHRRRWFHRHYACGEALFLRRVHVDRHHAPPESHYACGEALFLRRRVHLVPPWRRGRGHYACGEALFLRHLRARAPGRARSRSLCLRRGFVSPTASLSIY